MTTDRVLAMLLLLPTLWLAPLAQAQQLIANPDLGLDSLSRGQARLYFTRRLDTWPDGRAVRVFVLDDKAPLHREFCKEVLGLFPYQLRRAWDRLLFSGTGQPPTQVRDHAELLRRVSTTPGAIGYSADLEDEPGIRVIEVR